MSFTRKLAGYAGIDVDAHSGAPVRDLPPDAYLESPANTREFIQSILPTGSGVKRYITSLFPFLVWIHHYNLTWLMGDLIAGITVGFVVVPQGMAYALLAKLPVEYGLYTSFVGFILYWAFATSKDITIGVGRHPPTQQLPLLIFLSLGNDANPLPSIDCRCHVHDCGQCRHPSTGGTP